LHVGVFYRAFESNCDFYINKKKRMGGRCRNCLGRTYIFVFEHIFLPTSIFLGVLLSLLVAVFSVKIICFMLKGSFALFPPAASAVPLEQTLFIAVPELVLGSILVGMVALLATLYLKVLNTDCTSRKTASTPLPALNLDDDKSSPFADEGDLEMKGQFD